MKKIVFIVALLVALFAVSGASAGRSHHPYHPPQFNFTVGVNCGTAYAHNVIVHGTVGDLAAFLLHHPGSHLGGCPVVTPPVVVPPVPPVVIPPVVPDTPNVFLCYSHLLGSTPGQVDFSLIQRRVNEGWFAPIAVLPAEATKQGIPSSKWTQPNKSYVLVCNPDGLKATGTGLNGSGGDFLNAAAWSVVLLQTQYDPQHRNYYEIYS